MARKQSDYLANLLAVETDAPSSNGVAVTSQPVEPLVSDLNKRPVARAGMSLLGRENALARVASGEIRQVTQLLIDPARVRVWAGNARVQAQLTEASCLDLIDSIIAEGGQKVPVVVRRLEGDGHHDYELIAGTRRHFAVSWPRAHSYPDVKLLAQVADLDDEAAFRLADIENRARKDVSDIERARNYAAALDSYYGGKAVRMAERLKVSKGWLSKMLKAATIPDSVLLSFAEWRELTLNSAYKLAVALDDKGREKSIQAVARAIIIENSRLIEAGSPPLAGSHVLQRLMSATSAPLPLPLDLKMEVAGPQGRAMVTVKNVNRHGITLHLPMASGASDKQIIEGIREVLGALRENGIAVQ